MKKLTSKFKNRKGFSLPEVLVAVGMIAGVTISSVSLLVTSQRTNTLNADRLTAFYLAQEGLEITRNIRDSHWLQGLSWQGNEDVLGLILEDQKSYIVENQIRGSNIQTIKQQSNGNTLSTIKKNTPWGIKNTKCKSQESMEISADCNDTKIYTHKGEKRNFYSHQPTKFTQTNKQSQEVLPTKFHRWIEIEQLSDDTITATQNSENKNEVFRVKSIVNWKNTNNQSTQIVLETELSNWKQGAN